MQPLTTEQIRAVIARGKLKDTIFKGRGLFCLSIALLVIVALIADMAIKGSERFTLDFFLNFASRRATQAGILSAATIKNRLAYLRAACRYAWKVHGYCEHDPAGRMVMPVVRNDRKVYLNREQMLRIARAVKNRHARAAIRIGFYSGMREAEILRAQVIDGQFCGACHNGDIAWSVENCNLCHSGKPGTPTQVHESTIQKLAQPAGAAKK